MPKKKLRIFDLFTVAMKNFETQDRILFSWNRNRIALSHALAMQLYRLIPEEESNLSVDLCPNISKSSKILEPEILLHDRDTGHKILAVVCRNDYLTEAEQKKLIELRKNLKCELVLALAFMPSKNYSLLYRVAMDYVEYYHFDRNTMTMDMIRSSKFEMPKDKNQLTLGIGKKK